MALSDFISGKEMDRLTPFLLDLWERSFRSVFALPIYTSMSLNIF